MEYGSLIFPLPFIKFSNSKHLITTSVILYVTVWQRESENPGSGPFWAVKAVP